MSGEIVITVIGNLTADPILRHTNNGTAVASFAIASTPRAYKDGKWEDGNPVFMRCSAWKELGEHCNDTLRVGMRVIASGRLDQRDYEKDGVKRTSIEMTVDAIGPDLKWATAVVTKQTGGGNGGSSSRSAPATSGDGYDQPPFFHRERFCNAF